MDKPRNNSLRLFPESYDDYLESDHWTVYRVKVKKRDKYRCVVCYRTVDEVYLHVHHRTRERLGNEMLSDCYTLCHECHEVAERQIALYKLPKWARDLRDQEAARMRREIQQMMQEMNLQA